MLSPHMSMGTARKKGDTKTAQGNQKRVNIERKMGTNYPIGYWLTNSLSQSSLESSPRSSGSIN